MRKPSDRGVFVGVAMRWRPMDEFERKHGSGPVLVVTHLGAVMVAKWVNYGHRSNWEGCPDETYYSEDAFTAWMPLPEPPKEPVT